MAFDVTRIRGDFPILEQRIYDYPLTYLDNAATTLKPKSVVEAISNHYLLGASNIHRGVHFLSEQATTAYERVREKVAKFINVPSSEEVIFTSGVTQGINFLAQALLNNGLSDKDEIIISHMEHHSNIVPWQMVCERSGAKLKVVPINELGQLNLEAYYNMLSPKTRIVSIVHVSNALGTINPVAEITKAAHDVGALVLLDGAQAVAHQPVDVQAIDCDFYVFSAHKLFGPTGCGVLYGKKEILESLPPFQGGGDMIKTVTFEETTYGELPARMEAGTPHIAGVIGLGAAIDYINEVGISNIAEYEANLLAYLTERLSKISGLKIIGTAAKKSAVVSFVIEGVHPHDIGTIVDRRGVAIRTGHHCTQPLMAYFKLPATARASLSIYNTDEDIDRLADSLEYAKGLFL